MGRRLSLSPGERGSISDMNSILQDPASKRPDPVDQVPKGPGREEKAPKQYTGESLLATSTTMWRTILMPFK